MSLSYLYEFFVPVVSLRMEGGEGREGQEGQDPGSPLDWMARVVDRLKTASVHL